VRLKLSVFLFILLASACEQEKGGKTSLEDELIVNTLPEKITDQYIESADAKGLGGVIGYGRGASAVDINNDGYADLFVVDTDNRHREEYGFSQVYLNNKDGTFQKVDVGLQPEDLYSTWSASFADYDRDGDQDLLLVNGGYTDFGSIVLYENRFNKGEGFVNVSVSSNISGTASLWGDSSWWGASWADYNNNGWLDVAVTRREGGTLLLSNNGNKTFDDVGLSLGIPNVSNLSNVDGKNPVWIDFDGDGDQDLYVAGIREHKFFENKVNEGAGFVDRTDSFPFKPNEADGLPVVFAAVTADFDQDGYEDLYLGRWDQQDYILFNNGGGKYEVKGKEAGIDALLGSGSPGAIGCNGVTQEEARIDALLGSGEPYENTMGLSVGDIGDNGYPDILIGTGDPETNGADIIFCNKGNRAFYRCTDILNDINGSHRNTRGHGVAFSDFDRDGFGEFFWNLGGDPNYDEAKLDGSTDTREVNKFYKRQTEKEPSSGWLTLVGSTSNIDAIGARVKVTYDDGSWRYYFIRSTQGFQSQNSKELLIPFFGFKNASVQVTWPGGKKTLHEISVGKANKIVES
jgi:hypothetical protein